MHEDVKSMGVKIRIGKPTVFGKMCFWLLGKVNSWKWMPIPWFIHQFGSLMYWGAPVCFPSWFWLVSPFFPWLEICFGSCWMYVWLGSHFRGCWVYVQLGKTHFGVVEWRRSRYLCFGGLRLCFSLSSLSWELLSVSLPNFCVFFNIIQVETHFFVNPSSWKYRSTF